MYQFQVTPQYGEPVTATIAEEWDQPAELALSNGDEISRKLILLYLESHGLSPHGRAVGSEYLAPMDFHHTFVTSDKFTLEPLTGEWLEYPSDETPPVSGDIDAEPVMDNASTSTPIAAIQSATTMDELEAAFYAAIEGADSDSENTDTSNPEFGLKSSGDKYRSRINQQTKDILARVDGDPSKLTAEDREILVQYSGRGGLKEENSLYEYYTPTPVAEGVWDAMQANGFESGNVLEPSAGAGVFSATKGKGIVLTASEIDPTAAQVNQLLHPEDQINPGAFESLCANTPDDSFDSVVGNIPFGPTRATAGEDPDFKHLKSFEEYFVLRAIDKCKPGGLIALICPTRVVDGSKCKKLRTMASRKAEFLGAHRMPGKTFHAQGTPVPTDAVFFRKHSRDALDKIPDLPTKTLKESLVLWNEFITGKYFKGEGKRFVHGTTVAGFRGDDVVDALMSKAATRAEGLQSLKKKLTVKFDSRIDWALLDAEEPIVRNYAEGDRKIINEREMIFTDGSWQPVIRTEKNTLNLEAKEYGVGSVEELKTITASNHTLMKLSFQQALAAFRAFPDLFSEQQKIAIKAAEAQGLDEYREQVFRGTLLGGLMIRMEHKLKQDQEVPPEELEMLQASIRAEYEKYGDPKGNKGLMLAGNESRYFGLFSGAIDRKGEFSDLMAGKLDVSKATFDATNIKSVVEELCLRQGNELVTLDDIKEAYKGRIKIDSLGDIAAEEGIAISPDGYVMPFDRYCSGEIASKLKSLSTILATEKDARLRNKFQKQTDEINRKRKRTKPEDIGFGLNQKWFDRKYLLEFLQTQGYDLTYSVRKPVAVEDPDTGEIKTEVQYVRDTTSPFGEFEYKDAWSKPSGFKLQFLHYLNGEATRTKKEDLEQFHKQLKSLQEQFNFFMQSHPDIEHITESYNLKFNGDIPYYYSGDDLKLEGVSAQVKPHWYQNQTIRRLSEEGRGIMGLDVGLGKTFSALGLAAYNRQMGRSKKNCIVVPNSVLANWYHETKMFNGNLDSATFVGFEPKRDKKGEIVQETVKDENGQPKLNKHTQQLMYQDVLKKDTREQIFEKLWTIPQSNKPLVIMSEEVFKKLPVKPDTKRRYQEGWVSRSLMSSSDFDKQNKSYDDAKRDESLRNQYGDEGTKKRGEYPYFEDCGFDSVMVDEAHRFKNVYKTGKDSQKIAYLPVVSQLSDRATDMAIKMSALRDANNGRGPIMLSATPVTNSPIEIFNMLSLVMPLEEFEQYGVYTPDDFVRVFGQIGMVEKLKITGKKEETEGLVGFQNLDGLRNLFHKYAVMKDATDVDPDNTIIKLPDSDEIMAECTLDEEQEAEYQALREEAEEATKSRDPVAAGLRPVFSIMRDMERVTTDMDLFRKQITWVLPSRYRQHFESLVSDMPETRTFEVYDPVVQMKEKETATLKPVYSDEGDTFSVSMHEVFETDVAERLSRFGIQEHEIAHPITPKYAKLMANLLTEYEAGGKQIIFSEEKTQHRKLTRIIVKHLPIELNQIGIINADEAAGAKLQKISDAYNRGDLKIVICNKKAEVGVNLQKGTTAIHHLTFPWTPASMQQRNGRGVRQGNTVSNVRLYNYAATKTMDEYRLTSMLKKAGWINDLINGDAATADNADVVGGADIGMFLAADPEAYKRQVEEENAKKAAEKADRDRREIFMQLNQLRNAHVELNTLEDHKAADLSKLEERKAKSEQLIAKHEQALKEDPDNEKAQKALKNEKAKLSRTLISLNEFEGKWESHKQIWLQKQKQTYGYLKARGDKGELPFDAALLEDPEGTTILGAGQYLLAPGMTFEQDRGGNEKALFRVKSVDNESGTAEVEWIRGYRYSSRISSGNTVSINNANKYINTIKQVSLSPDEVELLRLLDIRWSYPKLTEWPSKELFYDNLEKVDLESSRAVFRTKTDGSLLTAPLRDVQKQETGLELVWPDANDGNLKKELSEHYLWLNRQGKTNTWQWHDIMTPFFGSRWESEVASYGKKATQAEVTAVIAEMWPEFLQSQGIVLADPLTARRKMSHVGADELLNAVKDMGDNQKEIEDWVEGFIDLQIEDVEKRAQQYEAEQKRIEQEELRKRPDYREVPEEIAAAFEKMGITLKYNYKTFTTPRRKKGNRWYGGDTYQALSRLWIYDENAKGGKLYSSRAKLKSSFGAKYAADPHPDFPGSWWHVPASTDLQTLYEVIS